jgi:hypothetical protein
MRLRKLSRLSAERFKNGVKPYKGKMVGRCQRKQQIPKKMPRRLQLEGYGEQR